MFVHFLNLQMTVRSINVGGRDERSESPGFALRLRPRISSGCLYSSPAIRSRLSTGCGTSQRIFHLGTKLLNFVLIGSQEVPGGRDAF